MGNVGGEGGRGVPTLGILTWEPVRTRSEISLEVTATDRHLNLIYKEVQTICLMFRPRDKFPRKSYAELPLPLLPVVQ